MIIVDMYSYLGCWNVHNSSSTADHNRTIPSLEGMKEVEVYLDGNYTKRENAFGKCFQAAKSMGYAVFSLQFGECGSAATAGSTYKKYGESIMCQPNGLGGFDANAVYEIN